MLRDCSLCTNTISLIGLHLAFHVEVQGAHGNDCSDCMALNIMMAADPMYPRGYHPRDTYKTRDYSRTAKYYSRTRRPVKYYLTDFGISVRFDKDDTNPMAAPILSGDRSPPEFREDKTSPRNPFPTDVYLLGNVIKTDFLMVRVSHLALGSC